MSLPRSLLSHAIIFSWQIPVSVSLSPNVRRSRWERGKIIRGALTLKSTAHIYSRRCILSLAYTCVLWRGRSGQGNLPRETQNAWLQIAVRGGWALILIQSELLLIIVLEVSTDFVSRDTTTLWFIYYSETNSTSLSLSSLSFVHVHSFLRHHNSTLCSNSTSD